jgi:hypothetical protein
MTLHKLYRPAAVYSCRLRTTKSISTSEAVENHG